MSAKNKNKKFKGTKTVEKVEKVAAKPLRSAPASSRYEPVLLRDNWIWIMVGFALIVIGFLLMTGGRQAPNEFNADEIYSFRRITLAPIVVILGFCVEIFAIFKKPKKTA